MTLTRAFTSSGSGPVSTTSSSSSSSVFGAGGLISSGSFGIDKADHEILHAGLTADNAISDFEQCLDGRREVHHVVLDLVQTVLDALRDFNFALARQQLDRTHFAHVHADRVGRATKLGIDAGEGGLGFLAASSSLSRRVGQSIRLGFRCFFVHRDAHVINHVDDIFDLFGIDDVVGQVIVDLGIGQVTLLLASGDQIFELLSLLAPATTVRCVFLVKTELPAGKKCKRLIILF